MKVLPLLLLPLALLSAGKDCPLPVLNGKIMLSEKSNLRNNFPDNSEAFVECAKGYKRKEGSDTIICMSGEWSAVELICQKIDCGLPQASPHMTYSISSPDETLFGAYIKPICDRGYYLEGSSYSQCLVSGWIGRSVCKLITCNDPAPIEHGKFSKPRNITEVDDVIEYSCDENYTLVGNRSIICGENRKYSSPPPKCKEIECPVPEISFGYMTKGSNPFIHKSEATFECQPGYRMEGLPTSVCEKSGWSALPVCVKVIITQTRPSTATNNVTVTATTTATVPATTHSLGRNKEQLITHSQRILLVIIVFVITASCLFIFYCVHRNYKQRGSYNTGEGLRTKEELLLNQSL